MGNFIEFLYSRFLLSEGISIDTQTIRKNHLFFAISGPRFNANKFAEEALEKGASYAVVDDEQFVTNDRIILTHDGLQSLQELALFHRRQLKCPVVGITGSNGKTTTKELIRRVLAEKYVVHETKGNYNNHIGVPLTLLAMHPQVEIGIVEMGANHVGEIARLCEMVLPTHGLITNIGKAHTETFVGIEGVLRGKGELFHFLRKNNGHAFINTDDPLLSDMAGQFENPILYPHQVKFIASSPYLKISLRGRISETKMIGRYNYTNLAAAVAVGHHFEVSDDRILNAVASYEPDNARSQVIRKGSICIILDVYNANPDSMKVALENLAEWKGTTLAILGDMNELENPDEQHREVLEYARRIGIKCVMTVGDKIGKVANLQYHFKTKKDLEKELKKIDLTHSTILLKASRSIQLETILKSIE